MMKTPVLTDIREYDGSLHVYPSNLAAIKDKFIYLVVSGKKDMDPQVIQFYTHWLAKAASQCKSDNPESLSFLDVLANMMKQKGSEYLFWEYEITGCVIIHNLQGFPCVESFGNLQIRRFGNSMPVRLVPENMQIASVIMVSEEKTISTDEKEEKEEQNKLQEKKNLVVQGSQDSSCGGQDITADWSMPDSIKQMLSHPIVKKCVGFLLWLLIGGVSYFILTELLNQLIK